jgi:signal transduction histidine kinase
VEAMPEGGTLTLRVEPNEKSGIVTIVVADTGVGIRPEHLPHIFEPFYTTKEEGKGTGLGLSVVYGIIERHNGTITVSSEIGQGTSFTISLPFIAQAQESSPGPTS